MTVTTTPRHQLSPTPTRQMAPTAGSLQPQQADGNQAIVTHAPASNHAVSTRQQSFPFLSLPSELRNNIYDYHLSDWNANRPPGIRLAPILFTCKEIRGEATPMFHHLNPSLLAIGTNVNSWNSIWEKEAKRDVKLAGTTGLSDSQQTALLTADPGIRLFAVTLRIYYANEIQTVRRNIAIRRQRREPYHRHSEGICDARLKITEDSLILQLVERPQVVPTHVPPQIRAQLATELAETMAALQTSMQAVVQRINGRDDLKKGMTIHDVFDLAKTMKFFLKRRE